jgi:hypothetical protein
LKLRTFLHVVEKMSPVVEHPFQGWLPCLKLVWQPSVQLLEVRSSAASFAITESFAGAGCCALGAADGTRAPGWDAAELATRAGRCGLAAALCGLATFFGASIVTPGSWVCDRAAPLGPHNNAADSIATAEGATKPADIFMTRPPKSGRKSRSGAGILPHVQPGRVR